MLMMHMYHHIVVSEIAISSYRTMSRSVRPELVEGLFFLSEGGLRQAQLERRWGWGLSSCPS